MKGILACPFPVKLNTNLGAVVNLVGSSFVPTPNTIFGEIKKLPPGHYLRYQNGDFKVAPYWDIDFTRTSCEKEVELTEKLRRKLSEAVSIRLVCDRPHERVGTFLSGGVDSTTVTGLITGLTGRSVKSFSIGFDESQFNEIDYARIAARAFSSEHHEYFVTAKDTYDVIPLLIDSFDEPFANASAIPTYFCAKLARENGVDVLYAGDGGDELFAGNERYASQRPFDYYYLIPRWIRDGFVQPAVFGLANISNLSLFVKGKKYIERASVPYPQRLTSYGLFNILPMAELFDSEVVSSLRSGFDPYEEIYSLYHQAPARSELDRQLYIDLKSAISDNDLFKVNRMAEAAVITVRYPFLDHRLAEFAATVPAKVKMRGRQLRSFFKNAYADLLPQQIRAKRKHGFGLPIPVWLRTNSRLNEMMYDLVLSPRSIQRGYFRRKAIEQLVELHKTDDGSFYGTILWNLMVLELWHRKYRNSGVVSCGAVDRLPSPLP
jgi:asparagine synthase (glutamine-hydrolysing)